MLTVYPKDEFRVNTYTHGDQQGQDIETLTNGGIVVVWMSNGQDGSGNGVYGQVYDANMNKLGTELQINTYTHGNQQGPFVRALTNGNFIVVWHSDGQDGSGLGAYVQVYSTNGNKIGAELQTNTYTKGDQQGPLTTRRIQLGPLAYGLINGSFVVVWLSNGQDGSGFGVYGQVYNATASKIGNELQINTYTHGDQRGPFVRALINGGFVVVWHSQGQDGSGWGIYGQVYDSYGNRIGTELQINTYTRGDQTNPIVTHLINGGFIVVWMSNSQDGSGSGIYGQIYDHDGNKIGTELQINTYVKGNQQLPSVKVLTNGDFVVVWTSDGQDGAGFGVYGQVYNEGGSKIGAELQINTYRRGDQQQPFVRAFTNGGFAVVWTSNGQDGSGFGIYGQVYDGYGNKIGTELQINTYTKGDQTNPAITALTNNVFAVAWMSNGQDGSGSGIYGRIYNVTEIQIAEPGIYDVDESNVFSYNVPNALLGDDVGPEHGW